MANRSFVQLEGFEELVKKMRQFGEGVKRNGARAMVRAGATPMVATARRLVPKDSGLTKKSIGIVMRSYRRSHTTLAVLGCRAGFVSEVRGRKHVPANIAHLIEFGHRIVHRGAVQRILKRTLSQKSYRRAVGVLSSGQVPAHPFLRPAFDTNRERSLDAMRDKLAEYVESNAGAGWEQDIGGAEFSSAVDSDLGDLDFGTDM